MNVRTPVQVLNQGGDWYAPTARTKYRLACPRYRRPELLAEVALDDATALPLLVREEDPAVVFGALQYYDHRQLSVLCVALAAMVPPDQSAADLLGWLNPFSTAEVA